MDDIKVGAKWTPERPKPPEPPRPPEKRDTPPEAAQPEIQDQEAPSAAGHKSRLGLDSVPARPAAPRREPQGDARELANARYAEIYSQIDDPSRIWDAKANPVFQHPLPTLEDFKQAPFTEKSVPEVIMYLAENAHGRDPAWQKDGGMDAYMREYQAAFDRRLAAHRAWTNDKGESMGEADAMRLARADALNEVRMAMLDTWDYNRPKDKAHLADSNHYGWSFGLGEAHAEQREGRWSRFRFDYGDSLKLTGVHRPWERDGESLAEWESRWNRPGEKWEQPGDYTPYFTRRPFDPDQRPDSVPAEAAEAWHTATENNRFLSKMAGLYPEGGEASVIDGISNTAVKVAAVLSGLKGSAEGAPTVRNPTLDVGAQWMIRRFETPEAYAGYIRNRVSIARELLSTIPPEQDHRFVREALEKTVADYETLAEHLAPAPPERWGFLSR